MIWVRWAIPDMSAELRDQIRREAYITNEIIIRQEAERAREQNDGNEYFEFYFLYFELQFKNQKEKVRSNSDQKINLS